MPGVVVGLYCAVGSWFGLSVSTCTTAARETQAVFNQRAEYLRTWLGALNLCSGEGWQRCAWTRHLREDSRFRHA
jgi:hypothetical protein